MPKKLTFDSDRFEVTTDINKGAPAKRRTKKDWEELWRLADKVKRQFEQNGKFEEFSRRDRCE